MIPKISCRAVLIPWITLGILASGCAAHTMDAPHAESKVLARLEDERAISRLMAEYVWRLDAQEFDAYGNLFEEGVMRDPSGKILARGSKEIAAIARHYLGNRPDLFVRHIVSSPIIDIDVENGTAVARSMMTTIHAPRRKPAYVFRVARYHDAFTKRAGQWRFASRQEITDWVLKEHPTPFPRTLSQGDGK